MRAASGTSNRNDGNASAASESLPFVDCWASTVLTDLDRLSAGAGGASDFLSGISVMESSLKDFSIKLRRRTLVPGGVAGLLGISRESTEI